MTDDIKNLIELYKDETKRHFNVVTESIQSDIKAVAEQVGANSEKLHALTSLGRLGRLECCLFPARYLLGPSRMIREQLYRLI